MHDALKARASDPARDFCQWPYDRPNAPSPLALRQSSILFKALSYRPDGAQVASLLTKVCQYYGRFNTVWGLKTACDTHDAMSIELYFYDYDRASRLRPLAHVANALPDLLPVCPGDLDRVPYFMWSVEFPADGSPASQIDIYTDGFGGTTSGGVCHAWDGQQLTLKNLYHFFDAKQDGEDIQSALANSARTSRLLPLPSEFQPGAWEEKIFVFAQKKTSDAIYFSRLPTWSAIPLTKYLSFPVWLSEYMEEAQAELSHHLWDIGLDYVNKAGLARPMKAGIYGLL
jgi:hypothetical protein